jgi:AbrB family looped-hinge helix DNA binding protein
MTTKISNKGNVTLPARIRKQDGIKPGQEFEVRQIGRGDYLLSRWYGARNEGIIDWLLSCPERSYFVPIES